MERSRWYDLQLVSLSVNAFSSFSLRQKRAFPLMKTEKKKENSALYYYEVYGVMPSGFSCTSRESSRDKGVPASGAQHGTDENTVL